MRAIVAETFGGPEVLVITEVPEPVAGPGEVVVDVAAADVMFLDTRLRQGWGGDYFKITLPYVPGGAVVGTVVELGAGVEPLWLGRQVATHTAASGIGGGVPTGGYAERALAKADSLIAVPAGLTAEQSVALVHDGRTAFAVAERANIQPGEWVLITAAAGGLGVLLTQIAHSVGAHVVAAARGDRKLELAARLGAEAVFDYSEPNWSDRVRAVTGGVGVDLVLDGAGGELGRAALESAASGGRFFGYGSADGEFTAAGFAAAQERGVSVYSLFDIIGAVSDWNGLAQQAQDEVAAGRLEVVVGQTFPLERAADAHAAIEARAAIGRTLLLR